jgi:asparagine synthase (glutamine-hydrolysing)
LCGILSYYSKSKISVFDLQNFKHSLKSIKHRGPDGEGIVLINTKTGNSKVIDTVDTPNECFSKTKFNENDDFNLILGHRRLKILDLSFKGHQPMNFNKSWLTYNGEIYNYIEIRNELKLLGYNFITDSDTEVLLKAYDHWGVNSLNKFNGMWSFVLWDGNKKNIIISNDRYGIKPLYKFNSTKVKIFFSEIKQLKYFKEKITFNEKNCELFLDSGYQPFETETYFNEINRFKKGAYEIVNPEKDLSTIKKYYYLDIQTNSHFSLGETLEEFNNLFQDAVSLRTRSDVEIGIAISGGVDSSLVLEKISNLNSFKSNNLQSFSAIFPNTDDDESFFINKLLEQFQLKSTFINPIEFLDFDSFKDHIYAIEFPPSSMSYFSQFILNKSINQCNVKVNLGGQGADEIFGGYHKHVYVYLRSLIIRGRIIKYLSEARSFSKLKKINLIKLHKIILDDIVILYSFKLGLKKIDNRLLKYTLKVDKLSDYLLSDFNTLTLPMFLKADDGNSMAYGVETRLPFMDYRIVNLGFSIPENFKIFNGWNKYILRKSFKKINNEIKWRKDKKGFTSPFREMSSKIFSKVDISDKEFRKYSLDVFKDIFSY